VPSFYGNCDQLKQVIIGIILNAMDSMEESEHPQLEITTGIERAEEQECLFIRFKDNGCGIPPEMMDRLFEPFFTTKDGGKGVGLGLSICWGIVRSQGGTIDVDSTPGEGSVFKIQLPLQSSADLYDTQEYMAAVTTS
jgi:C4-dicarboxylate-specific signal transduction histidine kinase